MGWPRVRPLTSMRRIPSTGSRYPVWVSAGPTLRTSKPDSIQLPSLNYILGPCTLFTVSNSSEPANQLQECPRVGERGHRLDIPFGLCRFGRCTLLEDHNGSGDSVPHVSTLDSYAVNFGPI